MGIYCHEEHVRSSDVNGFAQPHESHSALHKGNEALLKVNLKSGVGWHQQEVETKLKLVDRIETSTAAFHNKTSNLKKKIL